MKTPYLFLLLLTVTLFSCNTDDASTDDAQQRVPEFYPITANTYWTYNNQNEQAGSSRDSLYVANEETQNGNLYVNLDARTPASAFMTQFLSNNLIRTTETQLFIDGTLGSPIEGLPDISLPLSDLKLYDTTVDINVNPELDISTGTITQDIMEIPITINYGITSTMLDTPETSTQETPQVASQLSVSMEIIAMVPVGPITIPLTVMQAQEVLVATNIYTDGIGLTSSAVLIEFTLEDLSAAGVELPFPESNSTFSTQAIDNYAIGE